jgi:hypothetical protein
VRICDEVKTGRGWLRTRGLLRWSPLRVWVVGVSYILVSRLLIAGTGGVFWPATDHAAWLSDPYSIMLDAGIFPLVGVFWVWLPIWGGRAIDTLIRDGIADPEVSAAALDGLDSRVAKLRLGGGVALVTVVISLYVFFAQYGLPGQRLDLWITSSTPVYFLAWCSNLPFAIAIANLLTDHLTIVAAMAAVVDAGGIHPRPTNPDGTSGFGPWNGYVIRTGVLIAAFGLGIVTIPVIGAVPSDPLTMSTVWFFSVLYLVLGVGSFVWALRPARSALDRARRAELTEIDGRIRSIRCDYPHQSFVFGTTPYRDVAAAERRRKRVAAQPMWPFRLRVPLQYFGIAASPIAGAAAKQLVTILHGTPPPT